MVSCKQAEVERRVYADRAEYMGDADFVMVPVEEISSDAYLSERMKDFNPFVASSSKEIRAGKLIHKESEETTHLSVIDKDGNSIAVTTTLNNSYGSFTIASVLPMGVLFLILWPIFINASERLAGKSSSTKRLSGSH